MLKKLQVNTVFSGIFLIASVVYFCEAMKLDYTTGQYAPGPGFIPRWVGAAMILLSALSLIQSFKEESISLAELLPKDKSCRINLYVCWGGLLFFVLCVKRLGFLPTSFVMLTALFSRGTSWKKAILVGAIVTVCCFVIFKILLQVQIPTNKFGW